MDDSGYLAEALVERVRDEGIRHRVLGDTVVVAHRAFDELPRLVARFCHDFDLQLVQLLRPQHNAWRFVLAWGDDLGRPRFLSADFCSDYYLGVRRLLAEEELLRATPDIRFIFGVIQTIERGQPSREDLSGLWHKDPRAAMEQIARFWRRPADIRLIAQAAKHGDWSPANAQAPRLRWAMYRAAPLLVEGLAGRIGNLARRAVHPPGATVAFIGTPGGGRASVMQAVARDLAPAALTTLEHDYDESYWVDLRVVFDAPEYARKFHDVVLADSAQPLPSIVAAVERAILRWLECRVESRFPRLMVGDNPPAARLLQNLCRRRIPWVSELFEMLLNCSIECAIRSPILMPHPFGIVIERGTLIGSRVTVMQQAMIGRSRPDSGCPTIEDNVVVGPGAKILGPVRVGRSAIVGANAVVTRDVPSHCTVVGANRVLGMEKRPTVAPKRRADHQSVVNT